MLLPQIPWFFWVFVIIISSSTGEKQFNSTEQSLGATLINCTVGKKWKYFIFLFLLSVFLLVLTFILSEMLSELSAKPEQSLGEVGPGYRGKGWMRHGYREKG